MKTLRDEFEPLLISPLGIHPTAELCTAAWDEDPCDDRLLEEIERAEIWLRLANRTREVNKRVGKSYGLKHGVESWFRARQRGDVFVSNGCFLMAAHRLGFKIEPSHGEYRLIGLIIRDTLNAWINISSHSVIERYREAEMSGPGAYW